MMNNISLFLRSKQLVDNFWKKFISIMGPLCINILCLMGFIKYFTTIPLFSKPSASFSFASDNHLSSFVSLKLTPEFLISLHLFMAIIHDNYPLSAWRILGIILNPETEIFKKLPISQPVLALVGSVQ